MSRLSKNGGDRQGLQGDFPSPPRNDPRANVRLHTSPTNQGISHMVAMAHPHDLDHP